MSGLRIDIRRRLGATQLDVQLAAVAETVVLFGPSGAGKTSVLNAVAGLLEPDEGTIEVAGHVVFRRAGREQRALALPPRERRVGYVFQGYALFPHMTALQNVEFPMRHARDRRARALQLLERLGMAQYAAQRPDQLSGGQQQRVAIARALALDSTVLLLDEPFAAVDAATRERLMRELRELQRERGLTVIVVTHDIDDAFMTGDRLAVMREGRIEQVGPIAEVFMRPATNGVADAVGIRNLIEGRVAATVPRLVVGWRGTLLEAEHGDATLHVGDAVTAYIRPEDIKIIYTDRPANDALLCNAIGATIVASREAAGHRVLQLAADNGATLEVRFPRLNYARMLLVPGERVQLALRPSGVVLLSSRRG
jgi:molybdate transport system ATP-binding protein